MFFIPIFFLLFLAIVARHLLIVMRWIISPAGSEAVIPFVELIHKAGDASLEAKLRMERVISFGAMLLRLAP